MAPTTVQQLLDHTEEIDQQIEKVLVGLYNDMTDHRAKVAAVSSKRVPKLAKNQVPKAKASLPQD